MNEDLHQAIDYFQNIKWKKLLRDDFGVYHLKIIKPHLDTIKMNFDSIIDHSCFQKLTQDKQNLLKEQLDSFKNIKLIIEKHSDITQN